VHYCGVLLEEGTHLSIGAHHHLEGGTLERKELLQRQGKVKGTSKGKVKAKEKGRGSKASKGRRRTKAKGTLLQKASREIFKGLQGFREGLLL
jgi:hypothetical protein